MYEEFIRKQIDSSMENKTSLVVAVNPKPGMNFDEYIRNGYKNNIKFILINS